MEQFTRSNVRQMEAEMIEVLNKYGFKNVTFSPGGARFSAAECKFKITGAVDGKSTRAETELAFHANADGIDINAVGPKGQRLTGYHSRKRKYPYIYVSVSGTSYKCSPQQARNMFPV